MREALTPYRGANKANYLCILATELMGLDSLKQIPKLLAGFESVLDTLHPDVAQAIRTLRICGFSPTTQRELRLIVDAYLTHHRARNNLALDEQDGIDQRYEITKDFSIKKRWSTVTPEDVTDAIGFITSNPPLRTNTLAEPHYPALPATVSRNSDGYRGDVEPLGFEPPPIPTYDAGRIGVPPECVTWDELMTTADRFDTMDVECGRQLPQDRRWYHRLHDVDGTPTADLLAASGTGLVQCDSLDLKGIKHLIGLPGAGKTTLLYLLAGCLADRDRRVCFLFPSIEVAIGFIETLERYGVGVGLLSGQGDTDHQGRGQIGQLPQL